MLHRRPPGPSEARASCASVRPRHPGSHARRRMGRKLLVLAEHALRIGVAHYCLW